MASWSIPKRFLRLKLYQGRANVKDTKQLAWLDVNAKVSFTTSETVSGAVNETNIEIGGLTKDKMVYLATSCSLWVSNYVQNQITLEAGYDNLYGVIFDGDVIEAIPNIDNADYSVKLKCLSFYQNSVNETESFSFEGSFPISQMAKTLADRLGLVLVNSLPEEVYVDNYMYKDQSVIQHMRNLSQITGLDIYASNGRLILKKRGEAVNQGSVFTVNSTNLIGAPEPTPLGCNVRIKLNPSIATGQQVKLTSLKFPTLNSENYVIQTFSHSGDTKGSKWQTNLTLIRQEVYAKPQL